MKGAPMSVGMMHRFRWVFSQIRSLNHISSIHTRRGGKEAVTFRLVRAENGHGFNGKAWGPLRKSKTEAKVMMKEEKEMEQLCRAGGIPVQHHGAAGFCNLSAMINSSEAQTWQHGGAETLAVCAVKGGLVPWGMRACWDRGELIQVCGLPCINPWVTPTAPAWVKEPVWAWGQQAGFLFQG